MHLVRWLTAASLLPEAPRGPLWAKAEDEEEPGIPMWKAALFALLLEIAVPLLIFGVDWKKLALKDEPPVIPVMSVKLDQPPQPTPPPPPPEKKPKPKEPEPPKKKIKKRKDAIALEQPHPEAIDPKTKIQIPKPEPEVKPEPPKPKPKPKPEPPPPEPEAPPLPSVFRDVKPVRKVRVAYPPEAEQQHIQGSVKVRLSVDGEGNVTDAQVLTADPPGVFDEAVLTAVKQYKFKKDGTSYQADQLVVFKIDD